jgi:hypothetical protein
MLLPACKLSALAYLNNLSTGGQPLTWFGSACGSCLLLELTRTGESDGM